MSAQDIDPHFTAMLDPSELEALSDDGYTDEERRALEKLAKASDEDLKLDDDGDDSDGAENSAGQEPVEGKAAGNSTSQPATVATAQNEASAAATPAALPDDSDDDDRIDEPAFARVQLPADFEEQMKSLSEEKAALRIQLKEGDIDLDEYEAKREALDDKRSELNTLKLKHDLSQEAEQNFYQNQWQKTINGFMRAQAKEGVIDYSKDEDKRKDLDTFVRMLGSDDKNADRSMEWFLKEAHKRVLALHDIKDSGVVAKAATQNQAKEAINKALERRKSPVDAAPANLSMVPGSDGPGDVGGEFADLDDLDGVELEDALQELGRKNPAALARYREGR